MSDTTIPFTSHHYVDADGVRVFYREAGPADAPVILLLHGFPTSSFQYRDLIPRLADRYRVIAPDLPGFGFTQVPLERGYVYTFQALAKTMLSFTEALGLAKYAMYVFDYGAPTGFRLALMAPERVWAIVSQNGNAYEEGLGDAWQPLQRYWREPTPENRNTLRPALTLEGVRHEYGVGIPNPSLIRPEGYTLDAALLERPGHVEIQLDLFLDYASNVRLYPEFHAYFRKSKPPLLAIWGALDPYFIPAGATAFQRDLPGAEVHLLPTGHFALETHLEEIVGKMRDFLQKAQKTTANDNGVVRLVSRESVSQVLERLLTVLRDKGITLFAVVDHSGEAAKVGMEMHETKLVIFGKPEAGTPVMIAAPDSALDLPLKILITELANGQTQVSYNSPSWLQARYDLPANLIGNLAVIERLAESAAGHN